MSSRGVSGTVSPMPSRWLSFSSALCTALALASPSPAQVMPADGTGANGGGVEMAGYTTSGSYFSRELGTPLRFGYRSEGYGLDSAMVTLGTMQVFPVGEGGAWFGDIQGTMSDEWGGGFNAGVGYRELVNMSHGLDPDRVLGASFWTDGQNTKSDNFFTQLGFGLESLGESFDLRMNGYFPLDDTKTSDPELVDIDTIRFMDNGLFAGTQRITTDLAHSVVDAEAAKRIGNLDAWALAAVYHLGHGSGDVEDETGFRVGVRGYAVPDLLLGLEYTDDDIYNSNLIVSLTWFVGRTHKGNAPVGTIVDRFREPVMRNNFIATTSTTSEIAGIELTDADTDDFFNFIHVDSNAAGGGDGTFENPFNSLAEAEAAQADGAYVYVHGGSVLAANDPFTLLDNVRFWGEGTNEFGDVVEHAVDTVERGSVFLPETSFGAQDEDSPTINVAAGQNFLVLADNNDVNNFEINGGVNSVTGNAINAPQLANLDINGPTGTGISLTGITGTAVVDNTVTITGANRGMLIDAGSSGMNVNARITNATGTSLEIVNRTGGTIAYGGSIQDDNAVAATAAGIIIQNNNDAIINFTQVIGTSDDGPLGIHIDSGNFRALQITGNDDGTRVTFADLAATAANADTIFFTERGTLTINDSDNESLIENTGTGDAFHYEAGTATDADAVITVAADITNLGGGEAVFIDGHDENNITFSGEITDTNSNGIVLSSNEAGTIAFNGAVNITNTGAGNGVMASGGGEDVIYTFTDINININSGTGFSVTGDGTLNVSSADGNNLVQTTSGPAIVLDGQTNGLTLGTGGAIFDEVNVVNGAAGTNAVVLRDLDGGQVRIGPTSGTDTGGTIAVSGTGTGIIVDDVASASINNVNIDKSGTGQGMQVVGQEAGASLTVRGVDIDVAAGGANGLVVGDAANPNNDGTATFTDLNVTTADGDAVSVVDNEGGIYIFNNLTAEATGTGDGVVIAGNSADTTVTFNGMEVTTDSGTGFSATGAVGAATIVAATGTNTVTTGSGTAVNLDTIATNGSGITFTSVTKASGANSGVIVDTVTGGNVTIGSTGTASTISSSGDAIVVENSTLVNITNVDVTGTGGAGLVSNHTNGVAYTLNVTDLTVAGTKATGIESTHSGAGAYVLNVIDGDIDADSTFDHTGSGTYTMLIDNTDFAGNVVITGDGTGTVDLTIDDSEFNTVASGGVAFALNLESPVILANVRVRRNSFMAADASAFDFNSNSGNTKTVNFFFDDNIVSNNSATANAADFNANGATILNATVLDSNFANAAPANADPLLANDFFMASNTGTTVVNLNLNNNTASGGAGIVYLREAAGDFNIQDISDVETRNPDSNITFDPNVANFDNINNVPRPPGT